MALKWRWLIWVQFPAAVWGALISLIGWTCPLTPMENSLRQAAGAGNVYDGGFIDRYLVTLIFPEGATREMAIAMGVMVIVINVLAYRLIWLRSQKEEK